MFDPDQDPVTEKVPGYLLLLYWTFIAVWVVLIIGGPYYVHHQCLKNGNPPNACHQ